MKITVDSPKLHADSKMPILDLKVWCEYRDIIIDKVVVKKHIVIHEFYSKPMAPKRVTHSRSAVPDSAKKTVATQEMLRVLLRCSPEMTWEEKVPHCNELNKRLQFSGYSQGFRSMVTQSALNAYKIIKEKDENDIEPMYRSKAWDRINRDKKKNSKKSGWYKKGGVESVIFVPATPRSELKHRIDSNIRDKSLKIKVVERGGSTIKGLLTRDKQSRLVDKCDCMVCSSGGKEGACRIEGAVYEIECKECNSRYIGETGKNTYTRINQHIASGVNDTKDSIINRHQREKHEGREVGYTAKVVKTYPKSAMRRQITESIYINKTPRNLRINNATEWNVIHIPRLNIDIND